MGDRRCSIIIPVWNGREYLAACLDGILGQIGPQDEVIVVDNCSSDGSAALVRERYPQARLIENERNLGFAGGCNVGLRAAQGEVLFLVNQDVVLRAGWLEAMWEALTPAEVGVVGCKLLYPDGTIQHAGGMVQYPLAHTQHHGYREPDRGQWDDKREVDFVTGAAIGLKTRLLKEVGLFDEGFFPAFYEEVDLCYRARAAGYQVIYVSDGVAVHHETTSVDRESIDYYRWITRGRLRFVLKHDTPERFHDEFVPAERPWLAWLSIGPLQAGLRMAYLDVLLGLQGFPRTGVLVDEPSLEAAAESLIALREALIVIPPSIPGAQDGPDRLTEAAWQVQERPFTSRVPIVGPLVARFREMWNSVSAKWYVRPMLEQQNEINRIAQERLAALQEILLCLDRETVDARRLQAEAMLGLQAEADRLRERISRLERELSELSDRRNP